MLAYLDTLIGFAVVMLIISLLITILTQIISALVNHRGSNLRWGLKTLFANVDPTAFPELKNQADSLAKKVLSHCLISDSWFSGNKVAKWFADKARPLKALFERFQLASAIRPSELVDILSHIAAALPDLPVQPAQDGAQPELSPDQKLKREITNLLAASNPTAARDIGLVVRALGAAVPGLAAPNPPVANPPVANPPVANPPVANPPVANPPVANPPVPNPPVPNPPVPNPGVLGLAAIPPLNTVPLLQDSVDSIRASAGKLEAWFGSIMDRVAQKFAMYMRMWTVAFACLFAFVTGLNAINLMSDLYSNGAFRNALVGAGQQVTDSAATALETQKTLATRYVLALQQALKEAQFAPAKPPQDIPTTAAAAQWIQDNVPEAQRSAVTDRFNIDSNAVDQKLIQDGAASAAKLMGIASKAGFEVVQFRWPADFCSEPLGTELKYLLGVFVTAGLLSLGAPFWFNALKSLTNLRPIVASKEQSESAQASAKK